ncbi:MAG: hypothetical protein COU31_02015 [Candidatus Magasanikbacteria bacterium CG10_big_fil_rev_8_21_14_0_10_40_10]|uniref:Uncharacterized protein n=1 Tax=Candidatus Magasanikbacteria bacterium CG10_big_fil_rev_8_21_14_0_10_40_10 TaxID=1974648 RepID=A0A2M6W4A1_9BACT|nr:MAG: hypothetical protein COU31_02015 [Candidatus Magasanikbacteria bacterium CG10_big_fil_rev_8_21_14_0_10_40_10]
MKKVPMETLTKTQTKTVTNTKLAVATLLALAAGGAAFIMTPTSLYKPATVKIYDTYCVVAGKDAILPDYNALNIGNTYAKINIGKTKNMVGAANQCSAQIYDNLVANYCNSSSTVPVKNLKLGVVGFLFSTSTNQYEMAFSGCGVGNCWALDACNQYTASSTQVGSLTVVKSAGFADSQVAVDSNNVKIAQYDLYASQDEDISVSDVSVGVYNSGIIGHFYLLVEGPNYKSANTFASVNSVNKFLTNYQLIIKAGQKSTIGLYANIKANTPAGSYVQTNILNGNITAMGQSSKQTLINVPSNYVSGQKITIISAPTSTPTSTVPTGTTTNTPTTTTTSTVN